MVLLFNILKIMYNIAYEMTFIWRCTRYKAYLEVITLTVLRSLWNICVTNDHGYVRVVVNISRSFPHSWLVTGFAIRLTRRVPLVEQELLTLPEYHLSSPPVFSEVGVTRSLILCFVDRCLSRFPFSFGHSVVCPSTYGLWLPLWYLQTLLMSFILTVISGKYVGFRNVL